ncbi:MAG: ADP-ribose pyrophosphatase [Oligoflexia bacterium]|nr:MAG: ADP-ribose pyrophosphatase [Oligoflexia bacterium]
MEEKVLKSRLAYNGVFLKVQQDQVEMVNGEIRAREYILHPGASMIIPLLDEETLIMEYQYRHALKKCFWEFPAGKIDRGEDPLQTAKRELKEETGFEAQNWRHLTTIHPVIGYADERIEIFLASNLTQGKQSLDQGELLEVHKVKIEDLYQRVKKGQITDVKTQIGTFWLEKVLKESW